MKQLGLEVDVDARMLRERARWQQGCAVQPVADPLAGQVNVVEREQRSTDGHPQIVRCARAPARERRRREERVERGGEIAPTGLRKEAVHRERADLFDRRLLQIAQQRGEIRALACPKAALG